MRLLGNLAAEYFRGSGVSSLPITLCVTLASSQKNWGQVIVCPPWNLPSCHFRTHPVWPEAWLVFSWILWSLSLTESLPEAVLAPSPDLTFRCNSHEAKKSSEHRKGFEHRCEDSVAPPSKNSGSKCLPYRKWVFLGGSNTQGDLWSVEVREATAVGLRKNSASPVHFSDPSSVNNVQPQLCFATSVSNFSSPTYGLSRH